MARRRANLAPVLAIILGVLGGGAVPVQTAANSRLRQFVGSPFLSSLASFVVGTLALLVVVALLPGSLLSPALLGTAGGEPAWIWLGGVFGVVYLTCNILLLPRLGALQTAVFPMAGQVLMGAVIDAGGLFESPEQAVGVARLTGTALVLAGAVGVALANVRMVPKLGGARRRVARTGEAAAKRSSTRSLTAWRLAGLVAGMLSASQTAVNGHLGRVVDSPWLASLVSFVIGTSLLVVVNLALRTWRSRPSRAGTKERAGGVAGRTRPEWWAWTGGLLGAFFVAVNATLNPVLGTGMTVVVVLLGMTLASMIVDQFGLLGTPRRRLTAAHLASLAVLVGGVALVGLAR